MSNTMQMTETHGIWANDYNLENRTDLTTAALVKAVLGDFDEAHRHELPGKIVSPEMGDLSGSTVETGQILYNTWIGVDKDLIADLINEERR